MRRSGWLARAAAVVVAAAVLLLALPAESRAPSKRQLRNQYLRELRAWTDELKLYKGFQTALILRATYLSAEMRQTLAGERRRLVNPTPQDHDAFVARMSEDGSGFHDVVFTAMTPLPAARRFGEADTGWVIWLEADGTREPMVSTEWIRRPSALHRELYDHHTLWSEMWIARFERTVANPSEVVLHVGSGYGNGDVRWTIRSDSR